MARMKFQTTLEEEQIRDLKKKALDLRCGANDILDVLIQFYFDDEDLKEQVDACIINLYGKEKSKHD